MGVSLLCLGAIWQLVVHKILRRKIVFYHVNKSWENPRVSEKHVVETWLDVTLTVDILLRLLPKHLLSKCIQVTRYTGHE